MDFVKDFVDDYFASKYGKIHFKHHKGKGPSVIFIHGFAASMKSWAKAMGFIRSDLDIYLIDLLGHGDSDAPDIDYSLATNYDILSAFIERETDATPVLIGHSYGGWLSCYYAARNKINGLIIEDASGLRQFMEERHVLNPEYRDHLVKSGLSLNPHEYVLRSMMNVDNLKDQLDAKTLAKINCKCLIVWGEGDETVYPKYAEYFNKEIQGSALEIIKGAKHTPHYSSPEAFAKLVNNFV